MNAFYSFAVIATVLDTRRRNRLGAGHEQWSLAPLAARRGFPGLPCESDTCPIVFCGTATCHPFLSIMIRLLIMVLGGAERCADFLDCRSRKRN